MQIIAEHLHRLEHTSCTLRLTCCRTSENTHGMKQCCQKWAKRMRAVEARRCSQAARCYAAKACRGAWRRRASPAAISGKLAACQPADQVSPGVGHP